MEIEKKILLYYVKNFLHDINKIKNFNCLLPYKLKIKLLLLLIPFSKKFIIILKLVTNN